MNSVRAGGGKFSKLKTYDVPCIIYIYDIAVERRGRWTRKDKEHWRTYQEEAFEQRLNILQRFHVEPTIEGLS